VVPQAFR
jgi:hypothetical protein